MTTKEFILSDLNAEKENYISMIRNSELTEDEKKVINSKIDAIDARIANAEKLTDEDNKKVDEAMKSLNSKFDAIKEKLSEKGVKVADVTNDSYLDSKNAVHDFADAMRNAKRNGSRFVDEWGKMLAKNSIGFNPAMTDVEKMAYMPTPVKGYIEDAWNEYADVLREFNITNAKSYMVRYTATDQDDYDVRAKGFISNAKKTKVEQEVTLNAKLITSEYVYKLIPVSNKTIWEDDTQLIQWVMNELFKQWNYEVLRAILIGDGRQVSDDDHITSIVPITSHINDAHVVRYNTAQGAESTIEFMVDHLIDPIYNGNDDVILFCGKADFTAMRKFVGAQGATPTYLSAEDVARAIGVKRIVTVPYLNNTNSGEVRAIAVHAQKYAITGSLTPDFLSWEEPMTNERYFRVEIPVGGDVAGLNMAVFAENA